MRMRFLFLLLFPFLFLSNGISQVPKDLNLAISGTDVKKIEKCQKQFTEANEMFKAAVSLYESLPAPDTSGEYDTELYNERLEGAFKKLFEGVSLFQSATEEVYTIYKKGADEFWEEQKKEGHVPIGLEKARYLELEARIAYDKSIVRRQFAKESRDFLEAISYVNKANRLDAEVLRNQGRALQIYQDFPVEYDYQWEDDVDIEEILAQRQAERNERNEKLFGKHKKEPKKNEPIIEREPEKQEKLVGEVVYRVQIAAHTVPLGPDYLNKIYKGHKKVDELQEDDWYKYQIGRFTNFSDAQEELEAANVERAFIVAYLEGERINVKEARKIAP